MNMGFMRNRVTKIYFYVLGHTKYFYKNNFYYLQLLMANAYCSKLPALTTLHCHWTLVDISYSKIEVTVVVFAHFNITNIC